MNDTVVIVLFLAGLALSPFILLMVTSFFKLLIVFSILRSAIGFQQVPPNQVLIGISIILTFFIMSPVGEEISANIHPLQISNSNEFLSRESADSIWKVMQECRLPIQKFLTKHAHERELKYYAALRSKFNPGLDYSRRTDTLAVLVPAFILSELKEAFFIGFMIYLPFIIIDMVVANILQAMGMVMLSPTTISLPFKLLLFVMVDGWFILTKALVENYLR